MRTIIFFRGRNTDAIIADATASGIVQAGDAVCIICRKDDKMAEAGDIESLPPLPESAHVVVVANGGTTAQLVPIIARLVAMTFSLGSCQGESYPAAVGKLRIVDVQPDGVMVLWVKD
jgi:hypothetical protein